MAVIVCRCRVSGGVGVRLGRNVRPSLPADDFAFQMMTGRDAINGHSAGRRVFHPSGARRSLGLSGRPRGPETRRT